MASQRSRGRLRGYHSIAHHLENIGAILACVFQFNWKPSSEFLSKVLAHHTMIGGYELVAYDVPPDRDTPRIVGWELFGPGPALLEHGAADTFEQAKLDAERRLLEIVRALPKPAPR
jgi:hypothetical protein